MEVPLPNLSRRRRRQAGANAIAKLPYKWGGGHGAWRDDGYDCSGSVSFALAGAGLLNRPLTSGLFMRYGGTRCQQAPRSVSGFAVRHVPGL